jgi:hypothetical protein
MFPPFKIVLKIHVINSDGKKQLKPKQKDQQGRQDNKRSLPISGFHPVHSAYPCKNAFDFTP